MNKKDLIEHAKSRVSEGFEVSYGDIGEPVIGALILRLVAALENQALGTVIDNWDYQYFYYGNMQSSLVRRNLDNGEYWVETKEWGLRWEQITPGEYEKYKRGAWANYRDSVPPFGIPEIFLRYYAKAFHEERNKEVEVVLIPLDTSSK